MTNFAQMERRDLAALLDEVGPDAPTLCEGWTTADLAAHLVVRERRPDGAIGIMVRPFAGWAERVRVATRDGRSYPALVERVRSGPPAVLAPLDAPVNTVEYFVHHEDVRRAGPEPWQPRQLDQEEQRALWSRLGLMGRVLFRAAPVGVELVAPGHGRMTAHQGDSAVTLTGHPAELILFGFGRQGRAQVEFSGDDVSVGRLRQTRLGF